MKFLLIILNVYDDITSFPDKRKCKLIHYFILWTNGYKTLDNIIFIILMYLKNIDF